MPVPEFVPVPGLDRAPEYTDKGFWVRQVYLLQFLAQTITAVIRLGDRSDPGHKNFIPADEPLPVRFVAKPGPPISGGRGNLLPDDGTTFKRTECIVKRIGELTKEDLLGMAPDTANQELVQYHLATVNDIPLPDLNTVVTIWRFEYCPKATAPEGA